MGGCEGGRDVGGVGGGGEGGNDFERVRECEE